MTRIALFFIFSVSVFGAELVDLKRVDYSILVDNIFAKRDNPTGKAWYPENRCILDRAAATALAKVQESLKVASLGLKARECYCPSSLGAKIAQSGKRPRFSAAQAASGGWVSVVMVDKLQEPVEMPTLYEKSTKPVRDKAIDKIAKANAKTLQREMAKEGFVPVKASDWWSFYYEPIDKAQSFDVPFSQIP